MFRFKVDHELEQDERLVAEYITKVRPHGHSLAEGERGLLALTNKRVLFYRQKSILRKLVKKEAPMYELQTAIYLPDVRKVSSGGMIDKWVSINGRKHFLSSKANVKSIAKIIKSTAKENRNVVPSPLEPKSSQTPMVASNNNISSFYAFCGKEMGSDDRFCKTCGTEVER